MAGGGREQLVDVAEREAAVLAGPLDLLERVALLAKPGDDARVRRGGGRPAAAVVRDHALLAPAAQRRRGNAGLARGLAQRQLVSVLVLGHRPATLLGHWLDTSVQGGLR